ncbi:MAG: HD domain-containing protein, partial [Gammaproteobacteria bacterium]|nr:HD domain-containing protein [Gammaproteobacteria bacterium]
METVATTKPPSAALTHAIEAVRAVAIGPALEGVRTGALEVAEILRALEVDDDVVIAALLQPLEQAGMIDPASVAARFGEPAAALARALAALGRFGLPADWTPERALDPA